MMAMPLIPRQSCPTGGESFKWEKMINQALTNSDCSSLCFFVPPEEQVFPILNLKSAFFLSLFDRLLFHFSGDLFVELFYIQCLSTVKMLPLENKKAKLCICAKRKRRRQKNDSKPQLKKPPCTKPDLFVGNFKLSIKNFNSFNLKFETLIQNQFLISFA